jgi:hypothetical protein
MKALIRQGIQLNKTDKQQRYVFYSEGSWHLGVKLPTVVDYREFYVIENGSSYAVCL